MLQAINILAKANCRETKLYTILVEEMAQKLRAGRYNAAGSAQVQPLDEIEISYQNAPLQWDNFDIMTLLGYIGSASKKTRRSIAIATTSEEGNKNNNTQDRSEQSSIAYSASTRSGTKRRLEQTSARNSQADVSRLPPSTKLSHLAEIPRELLTNTNLANDNDNENDIDIDIDNVFGA